MGHKVHPTGFRLGVIRDWQSKWYAEKHYAEFLLEDVKLRETIKSKYSEAGISLVEIDRQTKDISITIHTARPGIVIGRGGQRVDEMRLHLENLIGKRVRINSMPFTVVGVAPEGFRGVMVGVASDAWVPVMMADQVYPGNLPRLELRDRGDVSLIRTGIQAPRVFGRVGDVTHPV